VSKPSQPSPGCRRFFWPLVGVFVFLAVGISSLSRFYYASQARHARVFKEEGLAAEAHLGTATVATWRRELIALAETEAGSPLFSQRVQDLIAGRNVAAAGAAVANELEGLRKNVSFDGAAIVLPGGSVVLTVPDEAEFGSTAESVRAGHVSWLENRVVLGTVEIDPSSGRRSIDLLAPIVADDRPIALLRLRLDPAKTLDPLLRSLPARGPQSDTLLLERTGDAFVCLNAPRVGAGTTPPIRLPAGEFQRPAGRESLGDEGLVEGRDHRGVKILGFIKAVPDSPWLVLAKTDLGGISSGMRSAFWRSIGVVLGFVLLCGVLLFLFWRRMLAAQEHFERTKWDDANRNMDEFMRQMINVMPNPAFFKDTTGIYQGTNAAFEKLLGLAKKELLGKTIGDVAPDEIASQHLEHDQALLAAPGHQVYEAPLKAWDGEHHVIFIKSTYQRPDGTIGGIIGILKDMTQRLRAEEELEQLRRFSDSTIQTMTEGLVLTDSDGRFSFVNPAAAQMLGYTPMDMVDRDVISFIPKDQHAIVHREDEKRAKGISDRYELVFLHKDGRRRTFLVSGGPRIQGAQLGGTLAVLTDISDRKAMEEEIKALSLRDELTTLYNRRGFLTLAEQQLKIANRLKKKVALLYLDMDNLKRINDSGGHKMGDRALAEIAFVLKKSFREADIVGRLGGDEFSVLAMETTSPLNTTALVKRLRDKIEMFNTRSSAEVGFSLSISVGVFTREPEEPVTVEEMLSRADVLMYQEKRAKKSDGPPKPPGPSK
jgi:diguanylate cyclase (GGDEF)-like protein/PAS domain S-box-containing protein